MADGRWVMTNEEVNNVVGGFDRKDWSKLPNYKKHIQIDNRDGSAARVCAHCGSDRLEAGFGGYGEGYGYMSSRCEECGGSTDFVFKDEVGKYFE